MRNIPLASRISLAVLTLALASGSALGQEFRTWKDATGKFSIKAKFVSNDDGKLTLAREDGGEVEIELKKLCDADKKYVADLEKENKENPFKASSPDPFKAKKAAGASRGASAEPRMVNGDWSAARILTPTPEKDAWEVKVSPPPAPPTIKARGIGIPAKVSIHEKNKGMVVSADGKRAAIAYEDPFKKSTRLVLIDLEKGKILGSSSTPGPMAPLALSDDGSQILMKRDEFGFGNADRLELWTLGAQGISKVIAFFPYGDASGGDRDVKWGAFVDGQRALTVSNKGKLALWDVDSAKAIYSLDIQGDTKPGLSPDRKFLAFTTGKEMGILDIDAGEVRGLKPTTGNTAFAVLSFSPSGKKFAIALMDKVLAFDTATGEPSAEMLAAGVVVNGAALWTDEDNVLVGNQYLLDLTNQVKVWHYQGVERATQVGPITLLLADSGPLGPGAVVPAQLPHPAAKSALSRAMADPDFVVLKPGSTVRINVDQISDAGKRSAVVDALTAKLSAIGVKVGPGAALELVASTEVGKQRDISYRTFGPGRSIQNYKVQEYISRVKFVYQGKTAWESSTYNIPHMVMLRNGQTMEQYLREQEKPNFDFFSRVELPKILTRPTGTPTLGSSQVSGSGIR